MYRNLLWAFCSVTCVLAFLASHTAAAGNADQEAAKLLDRIGVRRGVCVLVGDEDCRLACALARQSELTLFVQLRSHARVEQACRAPDEAGLYGRRIFVAQGPRERIGLADNLADAVVFLPEALAVSPQLPLEEMLRVVRPQGKVLLGDKEVFKPVPEGTDDWTHHYHGPDNNTQSRDRLARAPYLTQFVAEPRYAPAPQIAVAAGGRLFAAFGNIAWHAREEPWLDTLVALNAYNGTILWRRAITPGLMVDRSILVATPEVLYLAEGESLKVLDAATGELRDEIRLRGAGENETFWKWIALDQGVLYVLFGEPEKPDAVARWRRTVHGWPWGGISEGYNAPEYRFGFGGTLLAWDPAGKKVLWRQEESPPIDSRTLAIHDGRIFYCSFGRYLACRDAASGREIWRRTAEQDPELFEAIGPYRPGQGYIPGWKSAVYVKCTDKALYLVGPQVPWLTALSAADGSLLFRHPIIDLQVIVRPDGLYTIGAQKSTGHTQKLDPLTGEVLATFDTYRRACTRATGAVDGILFRSHGGSGRLDTASGQMQWISPMRPSCHVGVIIAGGHLYWIPWVCDCNLQMFGVICCGPAGDFAFDQEATEADRLAQSPGTEPPAPFAVVEADWPTWRADNQRTARSPVQLPSEPKLLWEFKPPTAFEPTGPVAAGGLVMVAGHDGIVRALDADSGRVRWTAPTGGPVWFPPAIADGRAFVGSGDGWAYAFEAATGRLLWRFRAAPQERRIVLYGKLVSTWPVAGGVLADGRTVYLAAGMTDYDGTHVYALDAATGRIRWQNHLAGHLDRFSRRGVACQGELLLSDGKLYLASGNAVSPGVFDAQTGRCLNEPPKGMGTFARRGRELRLSNGKVLPVGQPLHSRPEASVFDFTVQWDEPVVRAADGELLCAARQTDAGDGWRLVARGQDSKEPLWTRPLPEEPIRWAVGVDAKQRIVVVLRGGRVVCFGPAGEGG